MSKVFTGAKGALKLNGVKVAFVGSVTINEENTLTAIDVMDQLEVAEHAETGHVVGFSCNLFVKWEGGSGSVDARGVWQGSWNFKGRIGRGL